MEEHLTPLFTTLPAPSIRLVIAIPTRSLRSPIESCVALGRMAEQSRPGFQVELIPLTGDSVFRMRDILVNAVLFDPQFATVTHILFVDDDIVWKKEDVLTLIASGKDFICGCYPKRQDNLEYVVNPCPGERITLNTGIQRAACIGSGFMLITPKCLRAITARLPRTGEIQRNPLFHESWFTRDHWYTPDDGHKRWNFCFFPMAVMHDPNFGFVRWLSEDWYFSLLAQLAGIQPYIHTDVVLRHQGEKIFG